MLPLKIPKFSHPPSIEFQRWMRSDRLILPDIPNIIFPRPLTFPNAETLIIYKWDLNALYYNLNAYRFPNIKNLYFLSESTPAIDIPFRFKNKEIIYYLQTEHTPDGFDISKISKINRLHNSDIIPILHEIPSNFKDEFMNYLALCELSDKIPVLTPIPSLDSTLLI
jgi:hypothetical protein